MALPVFPLKFASNNRIWIDQAEVPWRLTSDTFFTVMHHLSPANRTVYLKWLAKSGFRAVRVMLLVHAGNTFGQSKFEPNDWDNDPPFTTPGDFTTPNATYFNKYVSFINEAASYGIAVLLDHTYLGFPSTDQGWWAEIDAQSTAQMQTWGAYVGTTFNQDNVILLHFGDQKPSAGRLTRYQSLLTGLHSVTRKHFASAELSNPDDHAYDQAGITYSADRGSSDMHFDFWYGIGPSLNGRTYVTAREAWVHTPTTPNGAGEIAYLNNTWNPFKTRGPIRRLHLWSALEGGIAGENYGDDKRFFDIGTGFALDTLSDPSTMDMVRSNQFYDMLPWWLFRPSGVGTDLAGVTLIVSTNTQDDSYVTSCMASDGSCIVAHTPNTKAASTPFSVNLSKLASGRVFRAWWWDPTSGNVVYESGGAYVFTNGTSSQSFTPPGLNAAGDTDWNLVIEAGPYPGARGASRSPAVGPSGMGGSRMCFG